MTIPSLQPETLTAIPRTDFSETVSLDLIQQQIKRITLFIRPFFAFFEIELDTVLPQLEITKFSSAVTLADLERAIAADCDTLFSILRNQAELSDAQLPDRTLFELTWLIEPDQACFKSVQALLRIQNFDEALIIFPRISDKLLQGMAFNRIIDALIKANQLERARGLASTTRINDRLDNASLLTVAKALIKSKEYDQALETIQLISVKELKDMGLKNLALAFIEASQYDQALALRPQISADSMKDEVLERYLKALISAGKDAQVLTNLDLISQQSPQKQVLLRRLEAAATQASQHQLASAIRARIEALQPKPPSLWSRCWGSLCCSKK